MSTLSLGSLQATQVRIFTPSNGVWFADVELTLDDSNTAPTGTQTLTVGSTVLTCTVDPNAGGRFGSKASVRVIGGGGGWGKSVPAQHWHNDGGVMSTNVFSTTAAAVGETVNDATPARLGIDFVRSAGPAVRVLEGRPWYVDQNGVTQLAARTAPTPPTDLLVLTWDPETQVAELATDSVLLPGFGLTDTRWDGTVTVRDIAQTFSAEGARAKALCSANPTSRVAAGLRTIVEELSGVVYVRKYRYRVVSQGADGRLTLQAVAKTAGVPDQMMISPYYGAPGVSAKIKPGSLCLVEFAEGEPTLPLAVSFDGTQPIEVDVSAATLVTIGATEIDLNASTVRAGGSSPVAMAGVVDDWAKLVTAFINGLVPGTIPSQLACASTTLTAGAPTGGT